MVRYQDLDLAKSADTAQLYQRLRRAATRVCQMDQVDALDRECYRSALADAVAQVNRPQLTAYFRQQHGHSSGG